MGEAVLVLASNASKGLHTQVGPMLPIIADVCVGVFQTVKCTPRSKQRDSQPQNVVNPAQAGSLCIAHSSASLRAAFPCL